MLTHWALAVILVVQAGALDLLTGDILPSLRTLPNVNTLTQLKPLDIPSSIASSPKNSLPRKRAVDTTTKNKCGTVVQFFMSSGKVIDHLKTSMPEKIEQMIKCEKVGLAGLVGETLNLVGNSNLLSVINMDSPLDALGGLGGVLGKGGSSKLPKLPKLPELPLTSLTSGILGGVADQGILDSLPLGAKNTVNELSGALDLQKPLNGVTNKVNELQESGSNLVENSLQSDIVKKPVAGLLGDIKLEELLLGLKLSKVSVENVNTSMTTEGINVFADFSAFISADGLAGTVVQLLKFSVHGQITLNLVIPTNGTQCVNFQIQGKDVSVNKVTLGLEKELLGALPVPSLLPLNDIVCQVLTIKINGKMNEPNSCESDFSDPYTCKNSTGLFIYHVKSFSISTAGISISFCADIHLQDHKAPVPGSHLPSGPKNANTSLTLSHMMLKTIVTEAAKNSSVKLNDVEAHMYKITYSFHQDNTAHVFYQTELKKDGQNFANGETDLVLSHECTISQGKVVPDIRIKSSEHTVTPQEFKEEVQKVLVAVLQKFFAIVLELLKEWNIPSGITSSLDNVKINVVNSKDLQAAN